LAPDRYGQNPRMISEAELTEIIDEKASLAPSVEEIMKKYGLE
jgi:hypothetical protein|tara:strand:- start:931 stop:1059 length:129 start_codon:yes stop_codon:yes gene_type:complete